MNRVSIEGTPLLSIPFLGLPTWNIIYPHWTKEAEDKRYWRQLGASLASKAKVALLGHRNRGFVFTTVFLNVRLFPRDETEIDVFNVNIKRVTDGFTDAVIWKDDEWATIPLCMFSWGGGFSKEVRYQIVKKGKRKGKQVRVPINTVIIDVYELDEYLINGVSQPLPAGRERILINWERWQHLCSKEKW